MAVLLDLPNELIVKIILILHPLDVEGLARSLLNKRLYSICAPYLRERIARVKHAQRIMGIFSSCGAEADTGSVFNEDYYASSGLAHPLGLWGAFSWPPEVRPDQPLANFDFLDLRGDMYWLKPTERRMRTREANREEEGIMAGLPKLAQAASELGLALPEIFTRFMGDIKLRETMPIDDDERRFIIGPLQTLKIRDRHGGFNDDSLPGGYAFQFSHDSMGNGWFLYLDTAGAHCVLGGEMSYPSMTHDIEFTPVDPDAPVEDDDYDGKYRMTVAGFNFEDFLARLYFGDWADLETNPDYERPYAAEDEPDDFLLVQPQSSAPVINRNSPEFFHGIQMFRQALQIMGQRLPDTESEDGDTESGDEWADYDTRPKLPRRIKWFILNLYTQQGRSTWRHRIAMRDMY